MLPRIFAYCAIRPDRFYPTHPATTNSANTASHSSRMRHTRLIASRSSGSSPMPGMSGTELTALIRGHEDFAHTPIVFLTGDPDPERQFEALESGADDFLSKPIRPRHLIAAVHSRIKRARSLAGQRNDDAKRHPETSLYHRPHVLRALAAALADGSQGSALFVEIRNAALLRERYGYAGFEQLINQAGRRVAALAGDCPCARLNDNAFLVFGAGLGDTATQSLARSLRGGIRQPPFEQAGMLHLVDGFLVLVLGEFGQPPVLQHLGVQEVLVDRGQLVVERLVEVFDDLRIALHGRVSLCEVARL